MQTQTLQSSTLQSRTLQSSTLQSYILQACSLLSWTLKFNTFCLIQCKYRSLGRTYVHTYVRTEKVRSWVGAPPKMVHKRLKGSLTPDEAKLCPACFSTSMPCIIFTFKKKPKEKFCLFIFSKWITNIALSSRFLPPSHVPLKHQQLLKHKTGLKVSL